MIGGGEPGIYFLKKGNHEASKGMIDPRFVNENSRLRILFDNSFIFENYSALGERIVK